QHEVAVRLGGIELAGHLDAGEGIGARGVEPRLPDREAVRLLLAGARRARRARMAEERPGAQRLRRAAWREQPAVDALREQEPAPEGHDHSGERRNQPAVHRTPPYGSDAASPLSRRWKLKRWGASMSRRRAEVNGS